MTLETTVVLLALGLLAALLAGARTRPGTATARIVRDRCRTATPDDGPLGLGAGRTAHCPVCEQTALELVDVATIDGHDVPHVRCRHCSAGFTVRGTITAVPAQRPAVG
jgi:hypothetical protein